MNILLTIVITSLAIWILNGMRKKQLEMETTILDSVKNLQVTLPYSEIPRTLTVEHIQAHYNLAGRMWWRMILIGVIGFGGLLLFTSTTSLRLAKDHQTIEVITRNPFGIPKQYYDLEWKERGHDARWMWCTNDEGKRGNWKPADLPLINGNRLKQRE